MNRRTALQLIASSTLGLWAGKKDAMSATTASASKPMPTIFLAHGGPNTIDDAEWAGQQHRWAESLPKPKAILMVSAHWEHRPASLGATEQVPLVYDFYGFPERYYSVTYKTPSSRALADRIKQLVKLPLVEEPKRGLDHGAYIPLIAMYPKANIPVLQLSLPSLNAAELFALGRALAPLRHEGVLIVGSGHLTHNLRALSTSGQTPAWASDFDGWTADVLKRKDVDALLDYRSKAPGLAMSHPTHEHFSPVILNVGASVDFKDDVKFAIEGWTYGSLSKRSVQFG